MSTVVEVAISYGMGGDSIDRVASSGGGEDYLKARCLKVPGVGTLNSVYNWYQTQKIVDDIRAARHRNPAVKIAVGGDSLGDNEIGDIVAALDEIKLAVDLVFGFQGSEWGKHTKITENVKRALIIYNPNAIMTAGLGAYALPLVVPPNVPHLYDGKWHLGNNGKTLVRYVQIEAPHPDDWGVAQDLAFAEIKQLAKVA